MVIASFEPSSVEWNRPWLRPVDDCVQAVQDLHAVGTEGCQRAAVLTGSSLLSSNLLGWALEVCHGEVGGWRGSEREFYVGGCLCVVSRWNGVMRVQGSAALGGQECEHPSLVPVCIGSRPSTVCTACSIAVHHRLEGFGDTFFIPFHYNDHKTCYTSQ